ncbi:MAG TPA: hypothetical protein VGL81_02930 [Polyangiaceae bacterium]
MALRSAWAPGLAAIACAIAACSGTSTGGGSTSHDAGGEPRDGSTTSGNDGGSSTGSSGGGSSGSSGSGGESDSGVGESTCQTYASKAYACCQSSSSCGGVSEQTFLQYCEGFLPSCQVFYSCFLSASTCAEANECPTLGEGGCS